MALEQPSLKSFLAGSPLFGGLSEASLEQVMSLLEEQSHPAGALVCREGEAGRELYVVGSGEVVVCRRAPRGRLVRVARLGPGEFFGEMTLVDPQPRSATVRVEVPTVLYALSSAGLYRLYHDDLSAYVLVLQNLCRELARRLRRADARLCELADEVGEERTLIARSAPRPRGA